MFMYRMAVPQPIVYLLLGFGAGAVVGAVVYRVLSPPTILQPDPDDDDEEDDEEDDDEDESHPATSSSGGYRDFSVLHSPFKMVRQVWGVLVWPLAGRLSVTAVAMQVLCVNASLAMGKGKIAAQCGHATLGAYKRALRYTPNSVRR